MSEHPIAKSLRESPEQWEVFLYTITHKLAKIDMWIANGWSFVGPRDGKYWHASMWEKWQIWRQFKKWRRWRLEKLLQEGSDGSV